MILKHLCIIKILWLQLVSIYKQHIVALDGGVIVATIANDQGNRTTPSYVAFTDKVKTIGDVLKINQQ